MERNQIPLYLIAIALGFGLGTLPGATGIAEAVILPSLGVMLFLTFLSVPMERALDAFRRPRLLLTILAVNMVVVPAVTWVLTRFVAADPAMLAGVALVLLAPCVDYVVTFTRLAGGSAGALTGALPVLMLGQLLWLPVLLPLIAGPDVYADGTATALVETAVWVIAAPLTAAVLVRTAARRVRAHHGGVDLGIGLVVPATAAVLTIVVASLSRWLLDGWRDLLVLVPIYVSFAVVVGVLAYVAARVARLGAGDARAVVFSGVTRNSLVVLPAAYAIPTTSVAASAVVTTQTLVELLLMAVLVRVLPRIVR